MMPKIDANLLASTLDQRAENWTPETLHRAFLNHGCAVVRGAVAAEALRDVEAAIVAAYSTKTGPGFHVYDSDIALASGGRLTGFENVDTPLLTRFLELVYEGQSYRRASVTARRIQGVVGNETWQEPLDLHVDTHFHPPQFTVNFWIPFQACGVDAPGLQLLPLDYRETRRYSGYTGSILREGLRWHRGYFHVDYFDKNEIVKDFGEESLFRPAMQVGDLIISSNWIIHVTYRTPQMRIGRTSMEVRFICNEDDIR